MKAINNLKLTLVIILGSLFLFSYGCKDYKVDVKLNPDGSGERTVELSMKELSEGGLEIEADEFRKLFHLDKSEWEYIEYSKEKEGAQSGKSGKHVYRRTQKAKSIKDWREMGGDIHIRATLDDKRFAKVAISNAIDVELGTSQDGRSLTYRETLTCTKLRQAALTFMSNGFHDKVAAAYPMLGKEVLTELRGLVMGYFAIGYHQQDKSECDISEEIILDMLTEDASAIIKKTHPEVDLTQLREIINKTLEDQEDELDQFVKENLPGMYLAGHSAIILNLEMPGRIVGHNADEVDGQKLTWKIDLLNAFVKPVKIYALSDLAD